MKLNPQQAPLYVSITYSHNTSSKAVVPVHIIIFSFNASAFTCCVGVVVKALDLLNTLGRETVILYQYLFTWFDDLI